MSRAESTVAVTEGSGKNFHTIATSIGGTTKEDQVVVTGEHYLATYSALAAGVSTATSASHLAVLEGDGTNYIRLHRIYISQVAAAGAATLAQYQVFRTTTASTTGTALNPRPFDGADTNPYAGRAVTIPGAKGTEGNQLLHFRHWLTNSIAAQPNAVEWVARPDQKPIIVGPATTDGIALKIVTGIASGTVDITLEFSVSSFV
jgi:hypothetical protein